MIKVNPLHALSQSDQLSIHVLNLLQPRNWHVVNQLVHCSQLITSSVVLSLYLYLCSSEGHLRKYYWFYCVTAFTFTFTFTFHRSNNFPSGMDIKHVTQYKIMIIISFINCSKHDNQAYHK
jgi:hypothetical protein